MKKRKNIKNLEDNKYINYFDKTKYRAIIYNNNGEQIAVIKLNRKENRFRWNNKSYNVDYNHKSFFMRKTFFKKYKYFFYTTESADQLDLSISEKIQFNSELYDIMLETKVAKDLNNLNNNWLKNLDFKTVAIAVIIIAGLLYFVSNGGSFL